MTLPTKILLVVFVAVLAVMFTANTKATELQVAVNWTPPETRQNGEALPEAELDTYTIEVVVGDATGSPRYIDVPSPANQYIDVHDYPNGTIVLTYRIKVVDVFGLESPWSEPVSTSRVVAPGSPPSAPPLNIGAL